MDDVAFNELYAQVPDDQKDRLRTFRQEHPLSEQCIAGHTWRYIACGQGAKTIMLLAGGFTAADIWFMTIQALEGEFRIIAPDAPALLGVFGMDQVCEALVSIMQAEGVDSVTLVGLSSGGSIAQYLCQAYPERVEHMVLSHTGVVRSGREMAAKRMLRMLRLLPFKWVRTLLTQASTGRWVEASEWATFVRAYFKELERYLDKPTVVQYFQDIADTHRDFVFDAQKYAAWPGQVLLLGSTDDPTSKFAAQELQARYNRARSHLFTAGGHHVVLLYPHEYSAVLKGFLDEVVYGIRW